MPWTQYCVVAIVVGACVVVEPLRFTAIALHCSLGRVVGGLRKSLLGIEIYFGQREKKRNIFNGEGWGVKAVREE